MRNELEEKLLAKANRALDQLRGMREPITEDIFRERYYISPQELEMTNYRRRPIAAFNPAALKLGGKLLIFPRLVFDYHSYASSIGLIELEIDELLNGRLRSPLPTRIILWPKEIWERASGTEDPRTSLFNNSIYMLYTGNGWWYEGQGRNPMMIRKSVQGFAELELTPLFKVKRRGYFSIVGEGEQGCSTRYVPSMKDSAFIEVEDDKATMLIRPNLGGIALCWRAEADMRHLTMDEETLRPVMAYEEWEHKVGWSTNALQLTENEYLIGWHGVLKEDLSYRNGLAIVNCQGELLAVSNYLLAPRSLEESYGDYPLCIFGCGLVTHEDRLIWIGGISDYGIGIFIAKLKEALSKLKRVS